MYGNLSLQSDDDRKDRTSTTQGSALDAIALLLSDHQGLEVNSVEHIRHVTENTRGVSRLIYATRNLLQELENRTTGTSPLENTVLTQTFQRNHII